MSRASWLCPACNTSNHANDSRCRWCGSGRDVRKVRDRALFRALVADPFPPTPAPVALACPLDDGPGAGVGSPPTGASMDRTIRLVSRFLTHPLTTAAARVAVVGTSLLAWAYWSAMVVLP